MLKEDPEKALQFDVDYPASFYPHSVEPYLFEMDYKVACHLPSLLSGWRKASATFQCKSLNTIHPRLKMKQ